MSERENADATVENEIANVIREASNRGTPNLEVWRHVVDWRASVRPLRDHGQGFVDGVHELTAQTRALFLVPDRCVVEFGNASAEN